PVRAQIVEMAAKAVMLEELQEDLQRLLVNNGGIPMVLTRTGYWGRDFGEQRKYYETLRQLRKKLRRLVEPDYERRYIGGEGRRPPHFEAGEELEEWKKRVSDRRYVLRRMEEGWVFPSYRMRGYPEELRAVGEEVGRWKAALEELLGEDLDGLRAEWVVESVNGHGGEMESKVVPLRIEAAGDVEFGGKEWIRRVEEAHETLAWSRWLLGCDLRTGVPRRGGEENRIERLIRGAQAIAGALRGFNPFMGSEGRASKAAAELGDFLQTLIEVDLLLRLEAEAARLLGAGLAGAKEVLEVAEKEFGIVQQAVGQSVTEVVKAAELMDPLDPATRETWLQLLQTAVRRRDRAEFRRQVLRGATGLTRAGLLDVLGLPPKADEADVHHELDSHMGHMYDPDGKVYEAPWWAATPAEGTLEYEYRVLPWLDPELEARLEAHSKQQRDVRYRYVF
ncbi:MAG TPA: hypothetical protein G4O05_04550, partial [Caldilineae bacterium]|nr:hypothetical protein [Caldilineae bacterium]